MMKRGMDRNILDKILFARVSQYVDTQPKNKYINTSEVLTHLQNKHPEYLRRKKKVLLSSVQRVLHEILAEKYGPHKKKIRTKNHTDNSSDSEASVEGDRPQMNSMNSSMRAFYSQPSSPATSRISPIMIPSAPSSPCKSGDIIDLEVEQLLLETMNSNKKGVKKSGGMLGCKETEVGTGPIENGSGSIEKSSSGSMADLAGCEDTLEEVSRLLLHLSHPEVFTTLGVSPTRGILLHGPPGCGKTLLANAIGGEMNLPFFSVTATELVSGVSGESESNIRNLFKQARVSAPSILFLDEIDAIAPKREDAGKDMERRIVAQLMTCIDELDRPGANVLLLAATSRPDSIEPSLRRAGRLDREICLGIPNERQRSAILTSLCKTLKLGENFNFDQIAHATPGYVAADLVSLVREASLLSIERYLPLLLEHGEKTSEIPSGVEEERKLLNFRSLLNNTKNSEPFSDEKLADVCIEIADFMSATKLVQPSAKREGFATVPDVTWDDVGAMVEIREELTMSILAPVKYPEKFEALGLSRSQGILIAGPPGCGKTLIAKAVANESGINFISVKGPELLNMYVGESERAVRMVFQRARASAPCVIFFDEIDSLVPKRSASEGSSAARVVNQLLTELDGMSDRKSVFIIAATNRPDIIDPAMLRPGRLDKTLFVSLPNSVDRLSILKAITKNGTKPALGPDVVLEEIADSCEGYTGADLSALIREASICCLKEDMVSGMSGDNCVVSKSHFTKALSNITPSVTEKDRLRYEAMRSRQS